MRGIACSELNREKLIEDEPQIHIRCPTVSLSQRERNTVAGIDLRKKPHVEWTCGRPGNQR